MGATLIITLFVLVLTSGSVHNQVAAQVCGADLMRLMSQCQQYIGKSGPKVPPSPSCCAILRPIDLPCACRYVSKDIEKYVNMEKVVYVARSCGKEIPSGYKCGSYTVPAA